MRSTFVALTLALAGIATGCSESRVSVIGVDIHHSRFAPRELVVQRGTTMRFIIRNGDPIDHEFILGDEEVQRRHENGSEAHHDSIPGEVSVGAGEVRETSYTFTKRGVLTFACHLPGHFRYGMKGTVRVR